MNVHARTGPLTCQSQVGVPVDASTRGLTMIAPITQDKFEELQLKHGELYQVHTPQGVMYFKLPERAHIDAFHSQSAAHKMDSGLLRAADNLALDVIVYPSRDELKELLKKYSLLSGPVSVAAVEAASGNEEAIAKKP